MVIGINLSTLPSMIDDTRGIITVLDRNGLEAAACGCYRLVKREYERLLGGGGKARGLRRA
jgi:hypothetical protein